MHAPWRRGGRATESREVGPRRVESSRGAQRVCACAPDQTVCTLLARAVRRARALANMSERIGPPPPPPPPPLPSPPPPPPRIFATSFIGVESENQSSLQQPLCNCTRNGKSTTRRAFRASPRLSAPSSSRKFRTSFTAVESIQSRISERSNI